ncbi:BppU family phage baseplate upper protein [Fructobacillus tropaeoli]|uniref:BppU family phage baseplate upper protein n=1 Tax=Fructobacillus tropaeoli TaxID=709323 RepID=UPI0014560745
MSKTINLSLDTSKSDIQNPKILLRQGDGNYQTLRVTITSNGEPTDLTNADVIYLGTTSADHKIIDSNITKVDALNGVIDYRPPKQWGQDMGNFKNSYFEITTGDSTGSTASFKVSVLEAVDLNAEQAGDYITVVDGIVAVVRKELSDQLDDVKTKTDNATGLVKQASDNLVAMAQNYNTDITNKYNDANAKANDVNQKLNSGYFASKNDENIFEKDNHFKGNLSVAGSLNATADWAKGTPHANVADNAKIADTANYLNSANNQTVNQLTVNGGSVVNGLGSFKNGIYVENGLNSRDGIDSYSDLRAHSDFVLSGQLKAKSHIQNINVGKLSATIARFGSQVFLSIPTQAWPYEKGTAWTLAYDMVVPAGYRPIGKANLTMINRFKTSYMQLLQDGTMYFSDEDVDNSTQIDISGSWTTNDDFPY